MNEKYDKSEGVSSVVGEMLMLTLVLILASLFAISVSQFVPEDRDPSANIFVGSPDDSGHNITLWHKGGDPLIASDLKIIFTNRTGERIVKTSDNIKINNDSSVQAFMAGDYMIINSGKDIRGWDIQMATTRAVIFSGRIQE